MFTEGLQGLYLSGLAVSAPTVASEDEGGWDSRTYNLGSIFGPEQLCLVLSNIQSLISRLGMP